MMLQLTYLYRNLTRNVLRTLLTCAAVAFPIIIYVLSTAVIDGIDRFLENSAKQLRLAVTHRTSIINPLPASYTTKIRTLDPTGEHIVSVCGIRWSGGQVPDNSMPLSALGVDHEAFIATFPEHELTEAEIAAWMRDRQAVIVGRGTAQKLGVKVGDRLTIQQTLPPYQLMEFHVISLAENSTDPVTIWFRLDYLMEFNKQHGVPTDVLSFIFVKCASNEDVDRFRGEIDALFAGSLDETKTQDEKAFMNEYITQQFNLPRNLFILSCATVFVAVLAGANTMSMNFRDRINEFAVFKSIGFRGGVVFGLIQAESLFLCLLGGLAGTLGPYLAFTYSPLREYQVPLIQNLEIMPNVCLQAMLISLGIGIAAALWPSIQALRLSVVSALRNME